MLELVIDFFFPPGSGKRQGRVVNLASGDGLSIESWRPGELKRALNDSGWLADEVLAAGQLRQGKAPSIVAMATGWALVELLRPRRTNSLPREFVLALTADRVVAYEASGGGEAEAGYSYETLIKPGEVGAWPRSSVQLLVAAGPKSKGGTLELEGVERIPVARPNLNGDPNTDELIALLAG